MPEDQAMPKPIIEDKSELTGFLETGRADAAWRIGTEHEKLPYRLDNLKPLPYQGEGIRTVLEGFIKFGWEPVLEHGKPIAMTKKGGGSISLEPAGQLELSGALNTIHETCGEVTSHLQQCRAIASELGIGFWGSAFIPNGRMMRCPGCPRTLQDYA